MGLFNFLDPVLDFALGPLLRLGYLPGLLIVTLFISLIIVFIYKLTTDQERMKELKALIKKNQEKVKTLKDQPEKMMAEQKKMMSVNMELMKHSMRPTLFTFIPIIIIFGWLSAHFAFMPIVPGATFDVNVQVEEGYDSEVVLLVQDGLTLLSESSQFAENDELTWKIEANREGSFAIFFETGGQSIQKDIVVSQTPTYLTSQKRSKGLIDSLYGSREGFLPPNTPIKLINVGYEAVRPLPFTLFGWHPGWLGTYIIFSLLFSIVLRKLFKVA